MRLPAYTLALLSIGATLNSAYAQSAQNAYYQVAPGGQQRTVVQVSCCDDPVCGCESAVSCAAEPTCGCLGPTCDCGVAEPVCGVAEPVCGCAEPACGCDVGPVCEPACGCPAAPECGCESAPYYEPACGCPAACGCDAEYVATCDGRCNSGCKSGTGGCALAAGFGGCECDLGDPCELFGEYNGFSIGGWTQIGYFNKAIPLFNSYADKVQLQQQWLFAEKAIDASHGFDIGGRIDYVYGTDGPDTQAFGIDNNHWDNGWDNGSRLRQRHSAAVPGGRLR